MCLSGMRLFLSGGGSGKDSIKLDRKFASAVGNTKPLLYIPIAIDTKKHPYSECYKWISGTFNPLGINKIEMWTEKELKASTEAELKKFGGVYVGGGNTFYLLKYLRESDFLLKLGKLIRNNVPVYGGSAGAIICAKTIIPALSADPNDVGLKNFDAMDFVRGYDLWCHYEPKMDEEIQKYRKKYGLKIAALPENAGLYVTDKVIEVIGPGSAYLAGDKMKEVGPMQKI